MANDAAAREQELNARLRELLGEERSTALTGLLREPRDSPGGTLTRRQSAPWPASP
jgi:hypothetical protein